MMKHFSQLYANYIVWSLLFYTCPHLWLRHSFINSICKWFSAMLKVHYHMSSPAWSPGVIPSPGHLHPPTPLSTPHQGPFSPLVGGSNRYASESSKAMLTSSPTRERPVKHQSSGASSGPQTGTAVGTPRVPAIHIHIRFNAQFLFNSIGDWIRKFKKWCWLDLGRKSHTYKDRKGGDHLYHWLPVRFTQNSG